MTVLTATTRRLCVALGLLLGAPISARAQTLRSAGTVLSTGGPLAAGERLAVRAAPDGGFTLQWTAPEPSLRTVAGLTEVRLPGTLARYDGSLNGLPVRLFRLALPDGIAVTPDLIRADWTAISPTAVRLAATPLDGPTAPDAATSRALWGSTTAPDSPVGAVTYRRVGGQRVAEIEVFPVRYNPTTGTVELARHLTLALRAGAAGGKIESPLLSADPVGAEAWLRDGVIGYTPGSAKPSQPSPSVRSDPAAPTATWYQPGLPYVRIDVPKSAFGSGGVTPRAVSFGANNLVVAGVKIPTLQGIKPSTFKLYRRGVEVPLMIIDGDKGDPLRWRFEFIPEAFSGDNVPVYDELNGRLLTTVPEHRPLWTDQTTYYLTWGGTDGRQIHYGGYTTPGATDLSARFRTRLHLEIDSVYHNGLNDPALFTSERMPAEGWYWLELSQAGPSTANLTIPAPFASAELCSLTVRLQSVSATLQHRIQLQLNGTPIGEPLVFPGVQIATQVYDNELYQTRSVYTAPPFEATVTFPASALNSTGRNQLTLVSQQSGIARLDWVEVAYPRAPAAMEGALTLRAPADRPVDVTLTGGAVNWTGKYISLYDLTAQTFTSIDPPATNALPIRIEAGHTVHVLNEASKVFPKLTLEHPTALRQLTTSSSRAPTYIVFAPSSLLAPARRLAGFHARVDGFDTLVVDVADLYKEYTFGEKHPQALKQFLTDLYHSPARQILPADKRFAYVALMGTGSLDPLGHLPSGFRADGSVIKPDLIPVYGNPATDEWYVSYLAKPKPVGHNRANLSDWSIGRITVGTLTEANTYVDRLTRYETDRTVSDPWKKQYLFINGGFDAIEQANFRRQSEGIIHESVLPCPIAGEVTRLYRDDTKPGINESYKQQIIDTFNRGVLVASYIGHAGSRTWDLSLGEPDVLTNGNRSPVVLSMSCHTGRFAEWSEIGFGEKFIRDSDGGAVGFLGTSGWGWTDLDEYMLQSIFRGLSKTNERVFGRLVRQSRYNFIPDTSRYNYRIAEQVDQYILHGDPALRIAVPVQPDFQVADGDLKALIAAPREAKPAPFRLYLRNNGSCPPGDTTRVPVTIYDRWESDGSGERALWRGLVRPTAHDSVDLTLLFTGQPGAHQLRVVIDPDGTFAESDEANNSAALRIYVYTDAVTLFAPEPDQAVSATRPPTLSVLAPTPGEPGVPTGRFYQFQIDTSAAFSSPELVESPILGEQFPLTSWTPPRTLPAGRLYLWRVRTSQDELGPWSEPRRFVTTSDTALVGLGAGQVSWTQQKPGQVDPAALSGLAYTSQGLQLQQTVDLIAISVGANTNVEGPGDYSYFKAGAREWKVYSTGYDPRTQARTDHFYRGVNIVALDGQTLVPLDSLQHFETSGSCVAVDSMATYLEDLPNGAIVMMSVADDASKLYDDSSCDSGRLQAILEGTFGATLVRKLRFRDSWAYIGRKGDRRPLDESYHAADFATTKATLTAVSLSGKVTFNRVGPASRWRRLHLNRTLNGGQVTVDVRAIRRSGAVSAVVTGSSATSIDLSGVNPDSTASLEISATLTRSPSTGLSSRLNWLAVDYDPLPELTLEPAGITAPTTVQQGDTARIAVRIGTAGPTPARGARVSLNLRAPDRSLRPLPLVRSLPATVIGSDSVTARLATAGLAPGLYTVEAEVVPGSLVGDRLAANNFAVRPIRIEGDTTRPTLVSVTFDGQRILDGDPVTPSPVIEVVVRDDSRLIPLADTSAIRLTLDGVPIRFNDLAYRVEWLPGSSSENTARVRLRPELSDGSHTLTIQARDGSGNLSRAGSVPETVTFTVGTQPSLQAVMTAPNPMRDQTQFVYRLTGDVPDEVTVRIFTVAGRLIRQLRVTPADQSLADRRLYPGQNLIRWDGRDEAGDVVANGTYLYRLSVRSGDQTQTAMQKLVVLR